MNRTIAGPLSACFATTLMAGGDNLGKNISRIFGEMDEEWVIKENPDFFIKLGLFFTWEQKKTPKKNSDALKKEILERPRRDSMTAVRNGGAFILDEDLCGGPRGVAGAYTAASRFHKDLVSEGEAAAIEVKSYGKTSRFRRDVRRGGALPIPKVPKVKIFRKTSLSRDQARDGDAVMICEIQKRRNSRGRRPNSAISWATVRPLSSFISHLLKPLGRNPHRAASCATAPPLKSSKYQRRKSRGSYPLPRKIKPIFCFFVHSRHFFTIMFVGFL
jgi:hypothetical protein